MKNDPTLSITRQRGEPVDRNRGGRFVSKRELRQAQAEAADQATYRLVVDGTQPEPHLRGAVARRLLAIERDRVYRAEVEGVRRRAKVKNDERQRAEERRRKWGY